MLRVVLVVMGLLAVVAGTWSLVDQSAQAQPEFKKEFDTKYLKNGSALHSAWEGKSTCNVCHIGGIDDRKNRNNYGLALDKFLEKEDSDALKFKARMKDPAAAKKAEQKIREALDKVEKMPSDPKDKGSATFGDLIKAGKLPVSPSTLP
jgi:hypothetical protein